MGGKTSRKAKEKYMRKPEYKNIQRNSHLKRKYGITLDEWNLKFKAQGSKCDICFTTKPQLKWWATDHCHETGKLRSILCNHCNNLLGFARDNPYILLEAFGYLCRHSGNKEEFLHKKVKDTNE
jgi:hypothetical protein